MITRQDKARAGMLAGMDAGHKQSAVDKRLAADAVAAGAVAVMPLEAVLGRVGGIDTREPAPDDVEALAASIDALGLLEPLVVDRRGVLLAGKTRLLAVRLLALKDPDRWGKVPVRRMDFIAQDDPGRALSVEVAENEQRRGYTAREVRALAERLQAAGFRATPGRPRKGEKALLPALGAVVGLHKRQLLRILNPTDEKKTVTYDTFSDAAAKLARALDAFTKTAGDIALADMKPNERRAVKDAADLSELLGRIVKRGNE